VGLRYLRYLMCELDGRNPIPGRSWKSLAFLYRMILALRDRMWEISPTLVRPDVTERTSVDVALASLQMPVTHTTTANASGGRIYENFHMTDPIS
jgi:hypothetical protein